MKFQSILNCNGKIIREMGPWVDIEPANGVLPNHTTSKVDWGTYLSLQHNKPNNTYLFTLSVISDATLLLTILNMHSKNIFDMKVALPGANELMLTLEVLKPEYSRITRSIPWQLMTWLPASPGHQQQWYWQSVRQTGSRPPWGKI